MDYPFAEDEQPDRREGRQEHQYEICALVHVLTVIEEFEDRRQQDDGYQKNENWMSWYSVHNRYWRVA